MLSSWPRSPSVVAVVAVVKVDASFASSAYAVPAAAMLQLAINTDASINDVVFAARFFMVDSLGSSSRCFASAIIAWFKREGIGVSCTKKAGQSIAS